MSIVQAFDGASTQPLWICKESDHPDGISRIKQEFYALHYLAQWAGDLGIPEVVDYWEEPGNRVFLIRSVLPGNPYPVCLPITASLPVLHSVYNSPIDWLRRFRRLVQPPQPATIGDLADRVSRKLRDLSGGLGPLAGLASIIDQAPIGMRNEMGVVTHGDFFPMNLLLCSDGRLGVIDWDHFGTGLSLQDLLTLLVGSNFVKENGKAWDVDEIWCAIAFSNLPLATFIQNQACEASVTSEALRYSLYYFAGWQITEGAHMEQPRWIRTVQNLAALDFPQPGTLIPDLVDGTTVS